MSIDVKPSGEDRKVPVPGRERVYFPHDVWTRAEDSFELRRLVDSGDLVVRGDAPADPPASFSHAES